MIQNLANYIIAYLNRNTFNNFFVMELSPFEQITKELIKKENIELLQTLISKQIGFCIVSFNHDLKYNSYTLRIKIRRS